ncbi:hypothetical protein BJ878DRAFT_221136 [Calycina marina]|uniref:Uncharacterized protein n=1 Tax=Calycina marina TaxID=1763456 RepID=A0A9P7YY72_9HELO|nr:hypothetical protein BJ878DRAFT_221136 [Calycina marina]
MAPSPMILLTPTEGMAPVFLGSPYPSTQPKWSLKILIFLWATQGILLLWREFIGFWGLVGTMLLGEPFNFLLYLANNVGNFVFLGYIATEMYDYRKDMLEIRVFYERQVQKTVFVGATIAFLLARAGLGAVLDLEFLAYIFWKVLICSPFAVSLFYARCLLNADIRGALEEDRVGMMQRRHLSPKLVHPHPELFNVN